MDKTLAPIIKSISSIALPCSIGKSGGNHLSEDGGDIDLFIFVNQIPKADTRQAAYMRENLNNIKTQVSQDPLWGSVDFVTMCDTEICIMYFTRDSLLSSISAILSGNCIDKVDNYFYPTGRIATIQGMGILLDQENFLVKLQKKIDAYPDTLRNSLVAFHLDRLADTEDLERAVDLGDVLFFHFAFDIALDHFLQALFALNRSYFPSRKRSFQYISRFSLTPLNCIERISNIVKLGGQASSLALAFSQWCELVREVNNFSILS